MKKIVKVTLLIILVTVVSYLLFYPVPFEPVSYDPPNNPGLKGSFAKNNKLSTAKNILLDIGVGPEDITFGPDSLLYTGLADGRIVSFTKEGEFVKTLVNTEGRPLGMQFDAANNLIVADEFKGLVSISPEGEMTVLADSVDRTKIFFADDLDIGRDGIIWFSDATQRYHADEVLKEAWELQPTGRLLSYNPKTKQTKIELPGLRFANGVALGPNQDYVLVNETMGMRINKLWIKGPKKGNHEIWPIDLPGYPDNISYNGNGIFWVALPTPRILDEFEALFNKPFLRKLVARLPQSFQPEPVPFGMVIGVDTLGQVVFDLQDSTQNYHSITSVNEYEGHLYLGSNVMGTAAKYKLE
jgi:sugar lactone lactonase YvrE